MTAAATTPSAVPAVGGRRRPPRVLIVLVAALAVGGGGYAWIHSAQPSVTTDNAYVKADITAVAPRVRGHVAQVLVEDNQPVKAGQLLVRLDAEEYAARVAAAEGDLAVAQAGVAAAEAALVRQSSDEAAARARVTEAETGVRAADAEARRAAADWSRYDALLKTGFAPRRDVDRVEAQAATSAAAADRSRADVALARSQAAAASARRGELEAAVAQARAQAQRAAAALSLARQDAAHTEVRAPISGVVGDRQAQVGDFVQPGSRLLALTPLDRLYVTANFKETQTRRMRPGQAATVRIDALDGAALTARVESVSPGTGSQFALLPFEPGVGNFTKIVQRVPVRLRLDPGQADAALLRAGLSAKVTVNLKRP